MRRPRMASKSVKLQSPNEGHRVQSLQTHSRTWPPTSYEHQNREKKDIAESVKACTTQVSIVYEAPHLAPGGGGRKTGGPSAPRSTIAPEHASNFDIMALGLQVAWLFVLGIPVACIAWTVTHEEVFREPRQFCQKKCAESGSLIRRKFFYLFTC